MYVCRLPSIICKNSSSSSEHERERVEELTLRVMFAAGGTGGHVFPAIAIADALKASHPTASIEFVGTRHRIEASVVPRAGYSIRHISAVALHRPLFFSPHNLLLPIRLLISLFDALRLLLFFRPHAVVGTGGYVSFPVCLAAAITCTPFIIQEQNAYPGLANRILAPFASAIFVAFAAASVYFHSPNRCTVSGNPVRASLHELQPQLNALAEFFPDCVVASSFVGLRPEVILIQGGSLGAQAINEAISSFVHRMLQKFPSRFIIWQTGSRHFTVTKEKICMHPRLHISEFIDDMKLAYSAADIVVASAGAITCSELLVSGKPSILVPLKYVVDDHQSKNAAAMAAVGACRVVYDNDSTSEQLEIAINELLSDSEMLLAMKVNALKAATTDASVLIANQVIALAKGYASE